MSGEGLIFLIEMSEAEIFVQVSVFRGNIFGGSVFTGWGIFFGGGRGNFSRENFRENVWEVCLGINSPGVVIFTKKCAGNVRVDYPGFRVNYPGWVWDSHA